MHGVDMFQLLTPSPAPGARQLIVQRCQRDTSQLLPLEAVNAADAAASPRWSTMMPSVVFKERTVTAATRAPSTVACGVKIARCGCDEAESCGCL